MARKSKGLCVGCWYCAPGKLKRYILRDREWRRRKQQIRKGADE